MIAGNLPRKNPGGLCPFSAGIRITPDLSQKVPSRRLMAQEPSGKSSRAKAPSGRTRKTLIVRRNEDLKGRLDAQLGSQVRRNPLSG